MSYIRRSFGYGTGPELSPGPELKPGWEVYKNQRGEILYGNNLIPACQFNAPLTQVQEQHIPVQARQTVYTSGFGGLSTMPYGYVPGSMEDPFAGRGGLKRKQSKRKRMQSRRKQSRRKQSRRKQSRRKQSRRKQSRRKQSRRRS